MQSHQKTNHSLKHSCEICGATYARGKFLLISRQFVFSYSYFQFYQGFALKDHIKEKHGGVSDELGQVREFCFF